MRSAASDLVVRGSDRYQCDYAAGLVVAPVHAKIVKPDKSAPGAGGPVDARVVDLSSGGAGVRSPLFYPQGSRLMLRFAPAPGAEPLLVEVRIQRVMMLDRTPNYYLGTAFEGLTPEALEAVSRMLRDLKASGAAAVPEKPRA